jgi:hypothetical protein
MWIGIFSDSQVQQHKLAGKNLKWDTFPNIFFTYLGDDRMSKSTNANFSDADCKKNFNKKILL